MEKVKKMKGAFLIALLMGMAVLAGSFQPAEASSPASLTLGKTVVSEGEDFSTRELGLPWWNMNDTPYPDLFTALKNIDNDNFTVTPNGFWDMTSTNTDPRIWLHWTGVGTTQAVLKMGDTIPIDAEKYKLLSYYMCLDQSPGPNDWSWAANVYWMYDRTPHNDPLNGRTEFLLFKNQGRFQNNGDCELITFDLSQPSAWATGTWDNNPRKPMGIRLDPINVSNAGYQLGWVRLTTKDTGNFVPITWSNAPAGTQKFYVSLTGCGQDGVLVGAKSGAGGTFNWGAQIISGFSSAHPLPLPESFEPGAYFIYMKDAAGAIACASNNPLQVHTAPILDFQKPSVLSGPEFASIEVNDPWGMANSADIEKFVNVTSIDFSNGMLSITANNSDPRLFMNLNDQTIPTSKYHYATFRFKINGTHTAGSGWIQRWLWWYTGGPGVDNVTTQDMQLYEEWHTYTIDLETAPTENCDNNCWSGTPQVLRFDPFETPKPTSLQIDYVLLTGDESVNKGASFPIYFTTTAAPNSTITFYYDTDTDPSNGRTLIGSVSVSPQPEAPLFEFGGISIYLPLIARADPREYDFFADSALFIWNTGSAPRSTLYISADVNDGVMVTTWYSAVPVTIK